MSIDLSQYKIGVILSLEDCGNCKKGGKALRACKIQIGGDDEVLTVVTSAPNVREKSRYGEFIRQVEALSIYSVLLTFVSFIYTNF